MVKIPIGSRKIQKSANRSYFLNLPLWWVKQNGLDKGDKVDIYRDKSGNLLLRPNLEFSSAPVAREVTETKDASNDDIMERLKALTQKA